MERRAYKQALFSVRDEDAALDIVQDSMLKLAEKYAAKPLAQLPMLFQRILQNTIRDYYRRRKVRSLWITLLSALSRAKALQQVQQLLSRLGADQPLIEVAGRRQPLSSCPPPGSTEVETRF